MKDKKKGGGRMGLDYFLWIMAFVGVWNGINGIARVYYKEPQKYQFHIVMGIWAIIILIMR